MNLVRLKVFGKGLLALTFGNALWGAQFIQNGSFNTSTYTVNTEFDTTFNPNNTKGSVSNWTSTGYAIYFINGTQTTVSAVSQWSNGGTIDKEKLYSGFASQNGGNFVGLDADPSLGGGSTLSQTMTGLTVGAAYQVTFYWAAGQLQTRTGAQNEAIQVQVFDAANKSALNYLSQTVQNPAGAFTGATSSTWFQVTQYFLATSTTETIKFIAKSTSTCLPPVVLLDGISVVSTTPEPATWTLMGVGVTLIVVARTRRKRTKKTIASPQP